MYHPAWSLPSHPSTFKRAVFSCWFLKPRLKPVKTALAYNRPGCGAIFSLQRFDVKKLAINWENTKQKFCTLNRVWNFPSNCNAVQRFTRWFDVKKGKKERILRLFLPRVVSEKEDVSWRQFCFYAFFSDLNCKVEWASGLECWILTSVDRSPRSEKVIFKKWMIY